MRRLPLWQPFQVLHKHFQIVIDGRQHDSYVVERLSDLLWRLTRWRHG